MPRAPRSTPPSTTGQSHDDVWWLPEVLRMRALQEDDEQAALSRLRAAAALASAHGSAALLRLSERDIAARGVRRCLPAFAQGQLAFARRAEAAHSRRTLRERGGS